MRKAIDQIGLAPEAKEKYYLSATGYEIIKGALNENEASEEEPFFSFQKRDFHSLALRKIFIVENKDTFWSYKRNVMDYLSKVGADMLIYGEGKKIISSFKLLKNTRLSCTPVNFFILGILMLHQKKLLEAGLVNYNKVKLHKDKEHLEAEKDQLTALQEELTKRLNHFLTLEGYDEYRTVKGKLSEIQMQLQSLEKDAEDLMADYEKAGGSLGF